MEEKLLKIAVEMSIENILKEMRKFSPDGINCCILINTRRNSKETHPEKQFDLYETAIQVEGSSDFFLSERKKVFWHFDPREGEGIRRVENIPLSIEENEYDE